MPPRLFEGFGFSTDSKYEKRSFYFTLPLHFFVFEKFAPSIPHTFWLFSTPHDLTRFNLTPDSKSDLRE